jgi:hypothetical protein
MTPKIGTAYFRPKNLRCVRQVPHRQRAQNEGERTELADHLKAAGQDNKRPSTKPLKNNGEPGGTRTRDHRIKSAMLYQLSYRPIDNLQGISKLGAASGVRHGLFGLFQPLHHQSTCEGMTKAMPREMLDAGRFRREVAVGRSLP